LGTERIISDYDLLTAFKRSGDNVHLGTLYKRHSHVVLGLALNYLKDKELSKDASMDIFEYLIKNLHKYDIKNFRSWLLTLTRNHCLKVISRSLKKEKDLIDKNIDAYSVEYGTSEDHYTEDHLNKLERAIEELKPHQQICINLFYLKGNSYEEIADASDFSLKEVKSFIQNGKLNLKKKLRRIQP